MVSSGPAPTGPCLSCAEGSRAGRRTPGGVSPEWSRGAGQNPLPRPAGRTSFDEVQDVVGLLDCECTLPGHAQFCIHQYTRVLLGRAALNPLIPQPVLMAGVAPDHVQDLVFGLVEPHEVRIGPLPKLVQVPVMASHPSGLSTAPLSLVSSANLMRVHLVPLSMLLM